MYSKFERKVMSKAGHRKDRISVVIPVFNGANFLCQAIESVLSQTVRPMEIIVVDDGSTDSTADLCHHYRGDIRYFYQENQGPATARNFGIKKSSGEFMAFLDADDMWLPGALEVLLSEIDLVAGCKIVVGLVQGVGQNKEEWIKTEEPYFGFQFIASLIHRSIFSSVGLFDQSLRLAEDVDWFFRVREKGNKIRFLNEVVALYRRHKDNITNQSVNVSNSLLSACRASLARRRLYQGETYLAPFRTVIT